MRTKIAGDFCQVRKWNRSVVFIARLPRWENMITRWMLNVRMVLLALAISKRINPNLIQIRNWVFGTYLGMFISQMLKKQLVYQYSFPFHIKYLNEHRNANLFRKVRLSCLLYWQYKIFQYSDIILSISEIMKNELTKLNVNSNKIFPIGLAYDNKVTDEYPGNLDNNTIFCPDYVLYIGTMDDNRNIEFLLNSWKKVAESVQDIKLKLVGGKESDIRRLEKHSAMIGISDSVEFVGRVSRVEVSKYINNCLFTVSPIPPVPLYLVSSPTKIFESLGNGKPVIATDLPEQRRIINDCNGGIIVEYTEQAFSGAILHLIHHKDDILKMGKSAKDYINSRCTYYTITEKIDKIYNNIVKL